MSDELDQALRSRSGDKCELCGDASGLVAHHVGPDDSDAADRNIMVCGTCDGRLANDAALEANHWFCLRESIWSEVPAVQVTSYRLLSRMQGEAWVDDLLGQAYLEESVLAWAQEGLNDGDGDGDSPTLDSNGAVLADGDSVTLIKDLDVKGTTFVAKRGTLVKNIRLIPDDLNNIEGRVNKVGLVLKTCFLKKNV